jgi:hypothetical protein
MFVAKNRNGPDGMVFPLFMDTSNVSIKVLDQVDDSSYEPKSPKELGDSLREKYKAFRKTRKENT